MSDIFRDCCMYIAPNGLLKRRIKLFEEQVTKYGGKLVSNPSTCTCLTHIVIEENYITNLNQVKNVLKTAKLKYEDLKCDIVGTLWLSRCIKDKSILDTENFRFKYKRKIEDEIDDGPTRKTQRLEDPKNVMREFSTKDLAVNEVVIEEFQKLAEAYRANGDRWRILAYDKAIASLKSWKKPISNVNDLKLLPHISAKMLDKISEIIENGTCTKVEEICSDEKTQVLETFGKVWGAGSVTAQIWYQKGYRSLEDLRTKANLTWQQKLGMKYYKEIQELIPREEVQEIVDHVKRAALSVDNSLQVMACGSFRRGKQMCGDIDVLVIARNSIHLLQKILCKLKNEDFLVDDLSVGKEETSRTYLGLCRLHGENSKIRRLDIFVINENMTGCALLHYTGSALFNRGIRIHAAKMNMKLTECRLTCNGQVLPTPTEESVFQHLKLEYRHPEDRATFHIN